MERRCPSTTYFEEIALTRRCSEPLPAWPFLAKVSTPGWRPVKSSANTFTRSQTGMCRFTAVLTTSATKRSAEDSVIHLLHSMTFELCPTWSWMTAAAKAEYNAAQRSWLWTASQSRTRRLRYPFSGRENPCLPQPSAALNNATNRFKQQMSITLFSKVL